MHVSFSLGTCAHLKLIQCKWCELALCCTCSGSVSVRLLAELTIWVPCMQGTPAFAEEGFGNLKPEARDNTLGLPLSDSRLPKGSTVPGDEQKIRSAVG